MRPAKQGVEYRDFGTHPGALTRHRRRRKPTSQMTVGELRAELDQLESGPVPAVEHRDATVQPADDDDALDEARHRAGLERLAVAAAAAPRSSADDADDSRELAALGVSEWAAMPERR